MKLKLIAVTAVATVTLAACAPSPGDYESTPVQVQTAAGIVTCQLYTLDRILWDRAIDRPESMDVTTADNVCREEGARIIREGR